MKDIDMTADQIVQPDTEDTGPIPHRQRWLRTRNFVAAAVAVVLVASASAAYGVDRHNQQVRAQIAAATVTHDDAVAALTSAKADYTKALVSAKSALASVTANQVTDQATLTALQTLVTQSDALLEQVSATGTDVQDGARVADIDSVTASVTALHDHLVAATQKLNAALTAVSDSRDAVLLDQSGKAFDAAVADLNAQVQASQGVLDGSAGKVTDDTVRQALQASIDAAKTAAGATKGATPDAIDAQTKAATDAKADLVAKTQAVTDAQNAWQAAQDAAAAAAAQSGTKSSTGTKSSGSTGTKSSGSTGTKTSGSTGSTSTGSTGWTGVTGPIPPSGQVTDSTPPASTPAQAIAGLQAARAAAGLRNVSSCSEIPGSVKGSVGIVHAITWPELLSSPAHRAMVMVAAPAIMSAWNAMGADGIHQVVYVQIWACIVPS